MKIITIAAAMALAATPALAADAGASPRSSARACPRESRAMRADLGGPRAGPDAPALRQGDPADSLYRRGREAMNRRNYSQAADLFKTVTDRYPEVTVGAVGNVLPRILALPDGQRRQDARVARRADDARRRTTLTRISPTRSRSRTRVCGELAQRGDAECAAEIASMADPDARPDRGTRATSRSQATQRTTCSDDDDDERVVALNALLQMDSDRALPHSQEGAGASRSLRVRAASQGGVPRLAEGRRRSGRHSDADREERPRPRDARAGDLLARPGSRPSAPSRCSRTC